MSDSVITKRLDGYPVGSPFHDGTDMFCDIVADAVVYRQRKNGTRVQSILLRGQADGLRNPGLTGFSRDQFPFRCQETFSIPLNDLQLAALRACIVRDKLLRRLGGNSTAAALWKSDNLDEPDGGATGAAWRSVTVEIRFTQ
jgi:hypothetical protein